MWIEIKQATEQKSLKDSEWNIVRFLYCIRKTKTRINIFTHIFM